MPYNPTNWQDGPAGGTPINSVRLNNIEGGIAGLGSQLAADEALAFLNPQPVKTANYSAVVGDFVPVDASGGARAITLPLAPANKSRVAVKKMDADVASGGGTVTVTVAGGSDVINQSGITLVTLTLHHQAAVFEYASAPATWFVVSTDAPLASLDTRYQASIVASTAASVRGTLNVQSQRVQLADNCIGRSRNTAVTSVGTYRFAHKIGVAGTDLQLGFGSWYTNYPTTPTQDVDPSGTVTFSAAFEDASGTVYALTFGGQRTVTLPGGGFILSDALPVDVAVGDIVYVRVYISAGTAYANRGTGLGSVGGFTATTDLTASGAGAVGTTLALNAFDAMCIVGTPTATGRPKSVVIQGDSIGAGIGDGAFVGYDIGYLPQVSTNIPYCGGGYLQRALSGNAGSMMVAQQGDTFSSFVAGAGHFRRAALTRFAKYAVIEYGRNDISALQSTATIQANLLTLAYRNVTRDLYGSVVVTLTPYTSSTDVFATVGNQTLVSSTANTNRIAYNTWVRGGCPIVSGVSVAVGTSGALLAGQPGHPILGYIDVAAAVESSTNSGFWKAANRVVTDAAITNGSGTLTSATANFTSADIGRDVNVAGAGTSGATLTGVITTVNSSTSVVITTQAATTVTGAQCSIAPYTTDGLHPSVIAHTAIAAAIQAPLLALLV